MAGINLTLTFLLGLLYLTVLNAHTCPISNTPSVAIGSNAGICLIVDYTNATTTSTHYYLFRITVDQFTSLKLNGLSDLLKSTQTTSATLTIQFQNQDNGTTFPVILNNTNTSMLQRSVISAVINTVSGGFTSIVNDNFCDFNCGNCYNGDCFDNFNNYGSPDLKVYISWAGSDSKNDQFLSQSQRLSRFNQYSVSSLYSSVKNIAIT